MFACMGESLPSDLICTPYASNPEVLILEIGWPSDILRFDDNDNVEAWRSP